MTLQEALESGKKFKRPVHQNFYNPKISSNDFMRLNTADIVATDWITEEESKLLTATDVKRAIMKAFVNRGDGYKCISHDPESQLRGVTLFSIRRDKIDEIVNFKGLMEELGFEE